MNRVQQTILSFMIVGISTLYSGQEQPETFKDKVEVVAIVVKDAVTAVKDAATDTADTVKRSIHEGTEVAKNFIASTAVKIKIKLQITHTSYSNACSYQVHCNFKYVVVLVC